MRRRGWLSSQPLSRSAAVMICSPLWLQLALLPSALSKQTVLNPNPLKEPADWLSSLIFNALSGFLDSWSSAQAPHGRSLVPGSISSGTVLYHMRPAAAEIPSGLDWFAFDAEHSYALRWMLSDPIYGAWAHLVLLLRVYF